MSEATGLSGRTPRDGLLAWAARDPDRAAISDAASSITFAELVPLVEATAAAARAALATAPTGAYLPVLVDRSAASVAAVLACVIGRVRFFPVDASAPDALVERLVRRAGDPGVFLAGPLGLRSVAGATAIDVDAPPAGPSTTGDPGPDLDEPAVVIFSSGSTGEPKGIVVSWNAMEKRWRSRDARAARAGGERRQPLVMPIDSSWGVNQLTDIASGFSVHIVDLARLGLPAFLAEMARFEPTSMALPSQLARLLAQLPAHRVVPLPTVRRVAIGSEGFRYEQVRGLGGILGPDTTIVHTLSSSEGGREIGHSFALRDTPQEGLVHLGQILFRDDIRLAPVDGLEPGVGEVHVSGAIASEYLDDPDLTAARFYADPDGRRWWRSGDLVSFGGDGMYRHEGRMDDVVKVGGRLASPADVTAVLLGIDGIRAAVTVPVVTDGSTRLVAHVETEPAAQVSLATVHGALADRLQPHAVPAAVMRHARLPITVRGKVDRQALADGPFESW